LTVFAFELVELYICYSSEHFRVGAQLFLAESYVVYSHPA